MPNKTISNKVAGWRLQTLLNWTLSRNIFKNFISNFRSSHPRCSVGLCNFIKIETLAQVLSCEFCKISKNTFFAEQVWVTASGIYLFLTILKKFSMDSQLFSTDTFNYSTRFFFQMGDGSFIFLKNSDASTPFISKHVQIECLQEPEAGICRCYTK